MRRKKKKHFSIYIAWILLLLCVIAGLKTGIEENTLYGSQKKSGMSIQSRWEDLWKEEPADKEKNQTKTEQGKKIQSGKNIRVLIMTEGYQQIVHKEAVCRTEGTLLIESGGIREECDGSQGITISKDDPRFQNGSMRICAKDGSAVTIESIHRGYGVPSYDGCLEFYATSEGVVIINELPVEQYLCKVVPSEMPASYQKEALKAQAVCARNYAYRQMETYAYPEYQAHVNDSTDYQVYNNSAAQTVSSDAVAETAGEILTYKGSVVTTYYYSTSCGKTTTMKAWGTGDNEKNGYLKSVEVKDEDGDYEKDLPWYRWEADIDMDTLSGMMRENLKKEIGTVQTLEVTEKGPGGVALGMKVTGDKGNVTVKTENKIRKALGGSGYEIRRQDGSCVKSAALLPSAFITIEKSGNVFKIKGGGYGHGIGMSQNGANKMAEKGKNYQEILQMFYPGTTIEKDVS